MLQIGLTIKQLNKNQNIKIYVNVNKTIHQLNQKISTVAQIILKKSIFIFLLQL